MRDWLRGLFGGGAERKGQAAAQGADHNRDTPVAAPYDGAAEADDEEDELDRWSCPVCARDIEQDGFCEHVLCAYEPWEGPVPPDTKCLVHFQHNALPQQDIGRFCAALSQYASRRPKREQWEELPDLLQQVVHFIWEHEIEVGDDTFAVSCDNFDDYLWVRLHEGEGYAGNDSVEGFEGGPFASVVFRVHYADDVPRVAQQIGEQLGCVCKVVG